ncbi:LytR/AlgR family response regulator transcription factor [Pedobacter flavus]|uniref:Response regulator n=1 Tax=Pedobacter flavus TaxID=3113906 RepID=A0ABU7H0Q8_9SPHI|nr:response regulator [Pedobacter sp. VNH31]MEE1884808.1 response regulator [Pedobacter sp. VNH31]
MPKPSYSCVIVDDQSDFIEQIVEYIQEYGNLEVVKTFTNSTDVVESLEELPEIDFLFLDIEMPSLDGIRLAKIIRNNINNLIFISAYPKYAIDAFGVSANGFLPKPVSYQKFKNLLDSLILKMA